MPNGQIQEHEKCTWRGLQVVLPVCLGWGSHCTDLKRCSGHVFLGLFTQRSAGHYFCVFHGGPEREGDDGGAVANGISSCLLVSPSFLVSFNDPAARRQWKRNPSWPWPSLLSASQLPHYSFSSLGHGHQGQENSCLLWCWHPLEAWLSHSLSLPEVLSGQPTRQIWSADVSCLFCNAYIFFNLLPTFKNQISHKNPELWLLLKSWNIWPHGSNSPTWQQSAELRNDGLSSGRAGALPCAEDPSVPHSTPITRTLFLKGSLVWGSGLGIWLCLLGQCGKGHHPQTWIQVPSQWAGSLCLLHQENIRVALWPGKRKSLLLWEFYFFFLSLKSLAPAYNMATRSLAVNDIGKKFWGELGCRGAVDDLLCALVPERVWMTTVYWGSHKWSPLWYPHASIISERGGHCGTAFQDRASACSAGHIWSVPPTPNIWFVYSRFSQFLPAFLVSFILWFLSPLLLFLPLTSWNCLLTSISLY